MTGTGTRSPEQLREEIRAERARLADAVGAFRANAKRTARVAGSALAAAGAARLLFRLVARRRG
jgi:hypothetical protein